MLNKGTTGKLDSRKLEMRNNLSMDYLFGLSLDVSTTRASFFALKMLFIHGFAN